MSRKLNKSKRFGFCFFFLHADILVVLLLLWLRLLLFAERKKKKKELSMSVCRVVWHLRNSLASVCVWSLDDACCSHYYYYYLILICWISFRHRLWVKSSLLIIYLFIGNLYIAIRFVFSHSLLLSHRLQIAADQSTGRPTIQNRRTKKKTSS